MIIADEGLATGATMAVALEAIRSNGPRDLLVAVPVGGQDGLSVIEPLCDELICLLKPHGFWSIGHYYKDFHEIDDDQLLKMLDAHYRSPSRNHYAGKDS